MNIPQSGLWKNLLVKWKSLQNDRLIIRRTNYLVEKANFFTFFTEFSTSARKKLYNNSVHGKV